MDPTAVKRLMTADDILDSSDFFEFFIGDDCKQSQTPKTPHVSARQSMINAVLTLRPPMPSISDASAVISHSPKPRPAHSRPVGDDDGDYGEYDEDYDGDDAAAAIAADGDEEGAAEQEEEDVDVVVEAAKVVRLSATMSASPRAAQGWTEEEFVKYMDWFRQVDTRKAGFITLQDMQVRVAQEGGA